MRGNYGVKEPSGSPRPPSDVLPGCRFVTLSGTSRTDRIPVWPLKCTIYALEGPQTRACPQTLGLGARFQGKCPRRRPPGQPPVVSPAGQERDQPPEGDVWGEPGKGAGSGPRKLQGPAVLVAIEAL